MKTCPHCKEEVDRVDVDNGVGIQYGPYGCYNCGWSEYPEYDCRKEWADGKEKEEGDGVVDPLGGWRRTKNFLY